MFFFNFLINFQLNANIMQNNSSLIGSDAPPFSLQRIDGGGYIHSRDILMDHNMVLVFFSSFTVLGLFLDAYSEGMLTSEKNIIR